MQTADEQNTVPKFPENKEAIQMSIDESVENVRKASYWFFGVAALSICNTVLSSKGVYFILGLAITQLIDAVVIELSGGINYLTSLIAPAIFILFGFFGAKLKRWAFIVGSIVYFIDGLLYVYFQEWMPVAIHLLVFYKLYRGYREISECEELSERINRIP